MRKERALTCAATLAVIAAMTPAVLVPHASAATEVPFREAKFRVDGTNDANCPSGDQVPPGGAINTQSWSGSGQCGGSDPGGSNHAAAQIDYTESWDGDDLRTIDVSSAVFASASTAPDAGSHEARAEGGYGIRIVVPEEMDVILAGSLTETPDAVDDARYPCAWVSLTAGIPGQPGATELFSQQGPGGPAQPSTFLGFNGCTIGSSGSSDFSFEGTVPAGASTLLIFAGAEAITSGHPSPGGDPPAEATGATFDLSLLLCTDAGTAGNDTLNGTDNDDVLCGLGGDDTITGGNGNDTIVGGEGNDGINGGDGADEIHGGPGDDTGQLNPFEAGLIGGAGVDTIHGDDGDDEIHGGTDADQVDGGEGLDFILGDAGDDNLFGEAGDDIIAGNIGDDTIFGGAGDDIIAGNEDDDTLLGGADQDNIVGHAGSDRLLGEAGNDWLIGDDTGGQVAGRDRLEGGTGRDKLQGGAERDCLIGGRQRDVMKGEGGRDTILARDGGRDVAKGGPGNDRGRFDGVDQVTSVENQNQGGC